MVDIKIDIIIPCYNAHETIDRTLGSILSQRIAPSIQVTLVNDAGKPYDDVIERWKDVLDIREIGYTENGGPAKSRNFGLQNTTNPVVMFMDSDDTLASPFSVILMCNELFSHPSIGIVISKFVEEIAPLVFKTHEKDTSFMHGKMYRREFLEKNNILQNEKTRSNEDVGFNILALLIARHTGYVAKFIEHTTYYWLYNPKSIVRCDKENYDHGSSYITFVQNLQYVFEELQKRGIDGPDILKEKVSSMIRCYHLYLDRTTGYPQFEKSNKAAVREFYHAIYKHVEDKVSPSLFNEVFNGFDWKGSVKQERKNIKKFIKELK